MVTQHGDDPCRHLRWKPVVLNYVATELHLPDSGAGNAVENLVPAAGGEHRPRAPGAQQHAVSSCPDGPHGFFMSSRRHPLLSIGPIYIQEACFTVCHA